MGKELSAILPFVLVGGVFVLIIALVVVLVVVQNKREKERTLQLQSTAGMLGLQFAATAPMTWIPNLERFGLFGQGHSKSLHNIMYGEVDGVKAAVFDYKYTVGSGKNSHTYRQSVIYFEPRSLALPFFSLRPEGVFHKLIAVFGYQDIDFGNRPEFSSKYLLRGPDEQAVRKVFTDAVLSFYEMNQGTSTDGGGNQLFIFRLATRTEPHDMQALVNWALTVKNLFSPRW